MFWVQSTNPLRGDDDGVIDQTCSPSTSQGDRHGFDGRGRARRCFRRSNGNDVPLDGGSREASFDERLSERAAAAAWH